MSVEGRWSEMAAEVPDDVVRLFAAVAPWDGIAHEIEARFGGIVDTASISFPENTDPGLQRELIQDLKRIPSAFTGFQTA